MKQRPCPVCSKPLVRAARSIINTKQTEEVDVCYEHGEWLDSGEFDRLMLAAFEAGLNLTKEAS